jgi:hypothetical protein
MQGAAGERLVHSRCAHFIDRILFNAMLKSIFELTMHHILSKAAFQAAARGLASTLTIVTNKDIMGISIRSNEERGKLP